MRVGHVKNSRISYGVLRLPKDRFADKKNAQTIGYLIRKPFPCQSVADLAMFGAIFVGTEASRMKGMPQGHPGWVYAQ